MSEVSVSRRLAAILAADVAGYSRLMGLDETGTMRSLVERRAIVDRLIAEYHGRIANTAGDSVLAEFPSVVDAMECAMAAQMELAIVNKDVAPDRMLQFRIGIHVGDVMVRDGDLFGDGINIAARIENLAEPGEIWASDRAREHVGDRLGIAFADQGERELKNIAVPVRVFRVGLPGAVGDAAAPIPLAIPLAVAPVSDRPAIAVLPFSNMSGDVEQEYFADGITEDLITDLSKISGLSVIARNSTFAYKGKSVNVPQVARELNARYVLEGSVRKAGSRVRITAQLIDGNDGAHRWAERYDRDLHDIFAVQDEVGQQIIAALKINLTPDEERRVAGRSTRNIDAYDLFLQSREIILRGEPGAAAVARPLLERAVSLDPNFAAGHAGLGFTEIMDFINNRGPDPKASLARAEAFATKAIALDRDEPEAQLMLALVSTYRHDREKALAAARRAIELDPSFVRAYATLANMLNLDGQPEEAIKTIQQAMRLDPRYPDLYLHFLGQSHFLLGRYESAIAVFEERVRRNKRTDLSRVFLAASYGHVGRLDEARQMWNEAQRISPGYSVAGRRLLYPYREPTEVDALLAGLTLAGITDNFPDAPDKPPEDS